MILSLRKILSALLVFSAFGHPPSAFASPADAPAKFEISGLGFIRNREISRTMDDFVNPGKVAHLSDDAAENAAFVLISELEDDGYLHPSVTGRLTFLDGSETTFEFDETLAIAFPRKAGTHVVAFDVERGVRFYIAEVRFSGLQAIEPADAAKFFQPAYGLWSGKRANVFSEASLRRGKNALLDALLLKGFAKAKVDVRSSPLPAAGAMRLDVTVDAGPRWVVSSVALADPQNIPVNAAPLQDFPGKPWSEAVRQDISVAARRAYYRAGYPDVASKVATATRTSPSGETLVDASVEMTPGPHVTIGEIRLQGQNRTRESVIKRRIRLEPGGPLDPTALERARLRLGRLSAFSTVDLTTEPAGETVRDVIFTFEEAPPWDASVLFGYGSYEQFRGGFEVRRTNLFGRSHQDRIFVVQSVKSTRADYTYTVPELFGETIDGSVRLFGLRRDEVAFRREEYGGTAQLRKKFGARGPELTGGYTFETLRDKDNVLATSSSDHEQVNAASINFGIALDRRDQVINPHDGFRVYLLTEFASEQFGGDVDYQRVEWGASWHQPLSPGRWIHAGLSQTAVFTIGGDPAVPPPVNKLYYPGGDNSLRGYGEGEAAPRAPDGSFMGAKTYTLINLEFEQAITPQWSAVVFFDWLTESDRLRDYPGNINLGSLGLGLRYRTIVGPIRVEYGRNLNPRPQDPGGSWHISIGYPF